MKYHGSDNAMFTELQELKPFDSETDEDYGTRCWEIGQKGVLIGVSRKDWDSVKVNMMYAINFAKYQQNPDFQKDLLATEDSEIIGEFSTAWKYKGKIHNWMDWNGLIQMRIREELRAPTTSSRLDMLLVEFENYQSIYR